MDCPGHATLIKTVLGGAQIIDVMLLVVVSEDTWGGHPLCIEGKKSAL